MKVYMPQQASAHAGGIYRVVTGIREYLKDVEFVGSVDECDVYHAHIAVFDKIPYDLPLVVSSHGMMWYGDKWGKHAWNVNKQCMRAYMQADVVTAPSHFVAHSISRNTLMPVSVVHHGIDVDQWLPDRPQGYVLWNKARHDPVSNPSIVNELAKQMGSVSFVSTFGKVADNVTITGRVGPDEVYDFVRHAGVYLDTPRESGGPCFGVLEAMSCGVPVVSFNNGGNAETITHGETGYLAKNTEDMIQGIYYCLDNRKRLGENARQAIIDKYQWKDVVLGYYDAYQQAWGKQQNGITVSIIVPCHNLGKYLPRCIESIKKQDFENWECIIIDDASTDDSFYIANQLAATDKRISTYKNNNNLHVSDTRNRGIALSFGRYIFPLDADDALAPNALSSMVQTLDADRTIDIVSGKLMLFQDGNWEDGRIGPWPNNADPYLQVQGENRLPYASMYRRRIWENTGGYRRRIRTGVEDADFWTRALSYGYKAEIIPTVTLEYTLRHNSLSRQHNVERSTWLSWFPWSENEDLLPAGLGDNKEHIVRHFDPPTVSVIIPVGPGHQYHVQAAIDSVVAQTFDNWEVVVVNDSGLPLKVPAFVRLVDYGDRVGRAAARNRGIKAARAERVVFLDADDVLQPEALDALITAHNLSDGYVYGDWYVNNGKDDVYLEEAPDWDTYKFLDRSLAPITCIHWKPDLDAVGGFNEDAPGWEDWDMQLRLFEYGICGTRVAVPLITYNMHYGTARRDDIKKKELLDFIRNEHEELYDKVSRRQRMSCKKCGGNRTVSINSSRRSVEVADQSEKVVLVYIGPETQYRTFKSTNHKGVQYRVKQGKPFGCFRDDAEKLLQNIHFKLVQPKATDKVEAPRPAERLAVDTEARPKPEDIDIIERVKDMEIKIPLKDAGLDLSPEVISILEDRFDTIGKLINASENDILEIKGVGVKRLESIQEALNKWKFHM